MYNHLLLLCLLLLRLDGSAGSETVEQRLRLHLLHTYDRSSLPPNITSVAVRFTVMHVNMVEAEEVMELDAWIMMSWMDSRLTWSEITASHVQKLAFEPEKVWHPDIVLFNNAEPWKTGTRPNTLLLAYPSGEILYVYPTRLRVPCVADLTYWPYDIHNCSAKYGSWVHDGYAFDLELHDDTPEVEIDLVKSFQEERNLTRGQWTVLGSSLQKSTMFYSCCVEPYPHITLRMLVQRNAPAFAYTLQMPAIALSLVTGVVFVLPPGALEKALLGGLCLLLQLHFLAYTAAFIPHSPSHTPILVRFVSEQLVLTAVVVVMTAVVIRLVRDPHPQGLPHAGQRVLAVLAACFCLGNYRRMASKSELSPYPHGLKGEDLELGEGRDFIGRSYPNGTIASSPSSGNNNTNESRRAPLDYLLLGAVVDRVCLLLYVLVLASFFISFKAVLFW
ncbi:acetylcholine receptor subunit alpha-type acr-16 isoform X1 [Hyalella azteca]|uniref:Acetylcholine receptor subunit alpha-type acr-16 isoform X1 n=1 Tax=Hyalella azteca TaxID=294128 RepID=A0A8B7NS72_HYAAZ|nr:acetylcholine receptor subunit alpha-type acr-16 isoform X1 [Hyalella azteca]